MDIFRSIFRKSASVYSSLAGTPPEEKLKEKQQTSSDGLIVSSYSSKEDMTFVQSIENFKYTDQEQVTVLRREAAADQKPESPDCSFELFFGGTQKFVDARRELQRKLEARRKPDGEKVAGSTLEVYAEVKRYFEKMM